MGRTFARLHLVQIDSVNVLSRSHYLPFFSRLGNYDRAILHRMAETHPRRMMEYWAHEASFIRPEHFPDLVLWQKRKWVGAHAMDPELRGEVAQRVLDALGARPAPDRRRTHRQAGPRRGPAKRQLGVELERGQTGPRAPLRGRAWSRPRPGRSPLNAATR